MIALNLLPWREDARAGLRRRFIWLLAGVSLAGCGVAYGLGLGVAALLTRQLHANEALQARLADLDAPLADLARLDLRHDAVRSRTRVIGALQRERSVIVILLEQVVRSMPAEVSLRGLRRRGEALQMLGVANSYAAVAELMRRLEESDAFAAAVLNDVAAEEPATGAVRFFFELSVALAAAGERQ